MTEIAAAAQEMARAAREVGDDDAVDRGGRRGDHGGDRGDGRAADGVASVDAVDRGGR